MTNEKSVVTPQPVLLAFPSLFEKTHAMRNDPKSALQYSCVLVLAPGYDLTPFKKAMRAAWVEKHGEASGLKPLRPPIKPCAPKADGTWPGGFEEGAYTIRAASRKRQPGVYDRDLTLITDPDKIYAGCKVNARLTAWVWQHATGSGVSFNIDMVQFVEHGDRLDGGSVPGADQVFTNLGGVDVQSLDQLPGGDLDDADSIFA